MNSQTPTNVFLKDILLKIEKQKDLFTKADEVLLRWEDEPLISQLYATPQSANYHAEGPTVRSHIQLMLGFLFAIFEGRLKLLEIEEFARLKGYEAEIQEMEDMIKENSATFEVFTLVHDIGKQFRVFTDDEGLVHYHGHPKEIFRHDCLELVWRMADAYRLTEIDVLMLIELISMHMDPLHRFLNGDDPKHIGLFLTHAYKRGLDGDDFVDMLQACVLLDQVFGSRKCSVGADCIRLCDGLHVYNDATHLINFFRAEHDYAPRKRTEKEKRTLHKQKEQEQKIFHECGLDGDSIMKLLGLKPSPDLGKLLLNLHSAARDEVNIPTLPPAFEKEIRFRIQDASDKLKEIPNRNKS